MARFDAFFGEGRRFLDLAANDVAGDDDDEAGEERDAPAPRVERVRRHVGGERQEDRGGHDLSGLNALQAEAGEEAAAAERRVLEDHRTRAGDLAGDGEALNEPQDDEKHRRQQADLLVGRQQPDRHGGKTHREHAEDQHVLAPVGVAVMAEDEGADRPRDVADAVGRQGRDDRRGRVALGEEDLREHQSRRRRVDEEVVVLQRRADPAAGGRFLRLAPALRAVMRE